MVRLLRPVTAVLVLVAVLSACSAGKDAVDQNAGGQYRFVSAQKQGTTIKSADRKPTGTVTGTLLSGGPFRLADLAGKVVVVNFFASWCAPCKAEGAAFADAADAYKGRVQFVGVAIDDSRAGALSYTHHYNWNWPIVFDPHDHLVGPFGLIGKPTTFVLDADGRVAWKLQRELTQNELSTALDDVLGK